jgi:hypothetical protein
MNNYKSLSKGWHVIVALLLAGLVLVTGCSETATGESPTSGSEMIPPLTVETLKNAAYRDIYAEEVQLTDGLYEGDPFVRRRFTPHGHLYGRLRLWRSERRRRGRRGGGAGRELRW